MTIRKINPSDNAEIEQIIKAAILEFGLPTIGTAFEDLETTKMHESYQGKKEVYYVIENNGKVLGGGGIKVLKNNIENICELQKMYFSPQARGKGYGKIMIKKCLEAAKIFDYDYCYLESDPAMKVAIHLYKKHGFSLLNTPLGGTGHHACDIWMLKKLDKIT